MTIIESIVSGVAGATTKKLLASKRESKPKRVSTKRRTNDAIADAIVNASRRRDVKDPLLEDFREDLFTELRKMIKPAIAQAKKGKPALLRILTRYGK